MKFLATALKRIGDYSDFFDIWQRYWRSYGGFRKFRRSPYLHISIIVGVSLYPVWTKGLWVHDVISITPNVIGFSLSGYAAMLMLSFSEERFIRKITAKLKKQRNSSRYMQMNAAFVHFISIQILALLSALIGKELLNVEMRTIGKVLSLFGFIIFVYSIATALAATMAIFRVASWYESQVHAEEGNALGQDDPSKTGSAASSAPRAEPPPARR